MLNLRNLKPSLKVQTHRTKIQFYVLLVLFIHTIKNSMCHKNALMKNAKSPMQRVGIYIIKIHMHVYADEYTCTCIC